MRKFTIIITFLLALIVCSAESSIFRIPNGITKIESEAFEGIPVESVFIPASVSYISDDGFSEDVTTVYGFTGTSAESFATRNGLVFIDLGITSFDYSAPLRTSPFRAFSVTASGECITEILGYSLEITKDGSQVWESGMLEDAAFSPALNEAGLYDFTFTVTTAYSETKFFFAGAVEVYSPVKLIKDYWLLAPGDSINPVDDTETRKVTFEIASSSLSAVNGSIKALECGEFTVTAKAVESDGFSYTDFIVEVCEPVTSLVMPESVLLTPSESVDLSAVFPEEQELITPIVYTSSDENVAVVDESGIVTAVGKGTCKITAATFKTEAVTNVTVVVPCESIAINEGSEITLKTGMKLKLHTSAMPENADDISVVWSVDDSSIVSINSVTGGAIAQKCGEAVITAVASDGFGATCQTIIHVEQGIIEISALIPDTLYKGETADIKTVCKPESITDYKLFYSSSNTAIVTVDENGVLFAKAPGKATVTVSTDNGVTVNKVITVLIAPTSLQPLQNTVYINPGMSFDVTGIVRVEPSDASTSELTIESSNLFAAAVSGSCIRAISDGTSVITVKCANAVCQFTVCVVSDGKVGSSASISPSYVLLYKDGTAVLTPDFKDAASKYKKGFWYSSDKSVVQISSVDAKGNALISATGEGSAVVYLIASGGKKVACEVVVNPRVASRLTLNTNECRLEVGESYKLEYSFYPAAAYENGVSFESSDPNVVLVDLYGNVTALSAGTARVSAKAPSGVSSSCIFNIPEITMETAQMPETLSGNAGEAFELCYTFEPANASPAAFRWYSDDENVVKVDPVSGKGTFVSAGSTAIHGAALDSSGLILETTVTVKEIPLQKLVISDDALILNRCEIADIGYSVYPENASYGTPEFISSDESVATVTSEGKVTAVNEGECVITVSAGHGSYKAVKTVHVNVSGTSSVEYRALIMGQYTIASVKDEYLPFSMNGTRAVSDVLKRSVIDGKDYTVKLMPSSPSLSSFRSSVRSLAQLADEDDVTVVFILTHGSYHKDHGYYMYMTEGGKYMDYELINDMKQISGHVYLVMCTCNSGFLLQSQCVSALRATGGEYQGLNGTGHLSILCSSTNTASSYYNVSNPNLSYDFFTKAFTAGLGWDMIADRVAYLAADSNSDGEVTFSEICSYSKSKTQNLISVYLQQNGKVAYHGDEKQYPSCFIANGEGNRVIFAR